MAEWQRRFWSTTASGYIGFVTRMLLGLVLFRLMFQNFTGAEFGFWALLWSLFGYGILLDFGFGFTAQKAVAEKTATGDMPGLSRLLATIFWTFVGMALLLLVVFLLIREPFLSRMEIVTADRGEFGKAYVVFFIGLAVMFPLGLFPEILRGLQRIDIANWVGTFSTVLNFVFLYWGLTAGCWSGGLYEAVVRCQLAVRGRWYWGDRRRKTGDSLCMGVLPQGRDGGWWSLTKAKGCAPRVGSGVAAGPFPEGHSPPWHRGRPTPWHGA